MRPPLKTALILIPVALVLGFVASSWLHQAQSPQPKTDNALLSTGMTIDASLTGLLDEQGRPVDDARFADRYRLVAFGFTSCPDVCPTMLLGVKQALEQLGTEARNIVPIFVSVDPERDTPERVAAYTASFDKRIVGLTGSSPALANVAKSYKVQYSKRPMGSDPAAYTVDHTALIFLIDPQQRIRALVPTSEGAQGVAQEIVQAYRALRQISASRPWARATPAGAQVGAAYVELLNTGTQQDRLLSLESPLADRVEVHETGMKDGMMTMRHVAGLILPPNKPVQLAPGGTHIMLMNLKQPLVAGQSFPLTLKFQHAPAITVTVTVAQTRAVAAPEPARS